MTPSATKIGVVLATYDRPDWLEVAIRSIQLSATVAGREGVETEILVVDDGPSGTATAEVCERLGVRCVASPIEHTSNCPAHARIFGLSQIDAPFHVFFDDDDVMLPRFLRLHAEAMVSGVDVVYSPFAMVDQDLRPFRTVDPLPVSLGDMLADHNMVNDHCLVRREAAAEGVWHGDLEVCMPFGAWLELAYRGATFVKLTEPTYLYQRHADTMTSWMDTDERYLSMRRDMIERYRAMVLSRDGAVPPPSTSLRLRRAVPSGVKQTVRSAKRLLPGG